MSAAGSVPVSQIEDWNKTLPTVAATPAEPVMKIGMGAVFGGVLLANLASAILIAAGWYVVTH